jgi:hypothetical protein
MKKTHLASFIHIRTEPGGIEKAEETFALCVGEKMFLEIVLYRHNNGKHRVKCFIFHTFCAAPVSPKFPGM